MTEGDLPPQELVDRPEHWPVHRSEDLYRGAAPFAVRQDLVSLPGQDETFWRVVVEHPGAVVVLALDEQRRVLVLRQYRHPAGMRFVELPAGLLDHPGEDASEAARRELLEEVGLEAGSWTHLSTVHNSPGISSERVELFLAEELREVDRGGFSPEHEEADMTVHRVPFAALKQAVLDGSVTDGPLAIAVLLVALRD